MKKFNTATVQNMLSSRGNKVPNQFEIFTKDGKYFQSYSSVIACIDKTGRVFLDADKWDYSKTTGVYRNKFLRETVKDTRKKIDSGEYKLVNLN